MKATESASKHSLVRMTARPLGLLLLVLAAAIAACGALGFLADPALGWDGEKTSTDFEHMLRSAGITAMAAIPFLIASWRVPVRLGRREALFVVSSIWVSMGLFGAIPYVLGANMSWADALFEAFSGLTTTGATILTDIEGRLSAPLHMWRMATHWLGGLGIVVLFVALMPGWGAGGKRLFQSEAAGPQTGGISPRIRDTAKTLLWIYCSITAVLICTLWVAGMPLFDAVTHSFSTIATGGFSIKNGSVGEYNNLAIELTILAGMLLAGTNFALFHRFKSEGRGVFWANPEFRVYILLVAGATLLITSDMLLNATHGLGDALRYSSFQVVAIMTGTGFGTADYEGWSTLSRSLLLMLYFCGGMAGSTTGSMKLIRIMIIVKVVVHEIRIGIRPTLVAPIRIGKAPVDEAIVRGTLAYALIFMGTVMAGALAVASLDSIDLTTAIMASLACVANVGPGMGAVGPTENYAFFSDSSKLVLSFCMLLGRLEFFSLLSLFVPAFWRR